jgi:AcrR family transcriptional regulator
MRDADLKARARIRDAALILFAADGVTGASVRAIASEAGVSPGLVIHHFGSKDGLVRACDEYVVSHIRDANRDATGTAGADPLASFRGPTQGPPLLLYLARRLTDRSADVAELVDEMVRDAAANNADAVRAGFMTPSDDPESRAAVLVIWSLGALVLGDHVRRILGADITGDPAGMAPYLRPAAEILTHGALSPAVYDGIRAAFPPAGTGEPPEEQA